MAVDPYSPCPGGTGKKIKFCCPDLVSELEKIHHLLESEQRAACLELIDKLEVKTPNRACLMSVKAMLQAQLGNVERAEATLAAFKEQYPDNPVALAEEAMFKVEKQDPKAAIEPLQRALAACDTQLPVQVYDALTSVAHGLLAIGQILAARGHLMLLMGIGGERDERTLGLLVQINGSPSVPLLLKQDAQLVPPPEGVAYKAAFEAALESAFRGNWIAATAKFRELAIQVGNQTNIWRNLAILHSWFGDIPGTIESLRTLAAAEIPLEDAVEAEALAQLIDPDGTADRVDVLTVPYEVSEFDKLQEILASDDQIVRMPIDLSQMGSPDEPPPRAAFWLLDRASLKTGVGATRQTVPRVVGQIFLFGKQTDRAARVELVVYRPEQAEATAVLKKVAGAMVGAAGEETITTSIAATQHALSWNWRLPEDTPDELRQALLTEERNAVMAEKWPAMPQKILGGRSALEVAKDPGYRIKLLAAILLLETSSDQLVSEFDFNELRSTLGLPTFGPIDPTGLNMMELPLVRMQRLEVAKLNDEQLLAAFQRADHFRHITALRKLAVELVSRPQLEAQIEMAEVHGILAQTEPDPNQAIEHLNRARAAAEKAGKSTAQWDLAELTLQIAIGDVPQADRLLRHIRDEHMREPGIAQALYQVLSDAGIIRPDGSMVDAPQGAAANMGLTGAPPVPAETSKLWTPGSDQPSGGGGGKKSAIWTPGD